MQVQLGKCQRCGHKEVKQESIKLMEASGPDAVVMLTLKAREGNLTADVCENCAQRMETLGWIRRS